MKHFIETFRFITQTIINLIQIEFYILILFE